MVLKVELLRTKNGVCNACTAPIMRSSFWVSMPLENSGELVIPISTSARPTIGTITWSPASGCTSMLMLAFSFSVLAIALAVV